MTTIAWDGTHLAGDRQATYGQNWDREVTKVHKFFCQLRQADVLAATCGNLAECMALLSWYQDGADPSKYPSQFAKDDCTLIVISKQLGIQSFSSPYPFVLESNKIAWGTGSEIARTCLHLGMSARAAVQTASELDLNTGNGIDEVAL